MRFDILRRQDKLQASVQRSYDELHQDLREITLRVEITEKAWEQQGAPLDVSRLMEETTRLSRRFKDFIISPFEGYNTIMQGIGRIKSGIRDLLSQASLSTIYIPPSRPPVFF